jgi:hypothetical protein
MPVSLTIRAAGHPADRGQGAVLVALVNVCARVSVAGQDDREREDAARAYFERHGRWPPGRE